MCLRAVGQAVVQPAAALSQWQRFRPVPLATTQGTQAQTHRQIEPSTSLNITPNGYPVNRIPIVHAGSVGVLALCGLRRESALQVQEDSPTGRRPAPLCTVRVQEKLISARQNKLTVVQLNRLIIAQQKKLNCRI